MTTNGEIRKRTEKLLNWLNHVQFINLDIIDELDAWISISKSEDLRAVYNTRRSSLPSDGVIQTFKHFDGLPQLD